MADHYCSIADVQRLCREVEVSATSTVTTTDVEAFINWSAQQIDSVLATLGYTVPVPDSATNALEALRNACASGAAYKTMLAAYSKSSPNETGQSDMHRADFRDFLNDLSKGKLVLTDAPTNDNVMKDPTGSLISHQAESDNDKILSISPRRKW